MEPVSFLPSEPPLALGEQGLCGGQVWDQEGGSETLPRLTWLDFVQGGCVFGAEGMVLGIFLFLRLYIFVIERGEV